MAPLVDNSQILSAELLSPLPWYLHLYVWPFVGLWSIFARYYLTTELYEKHIASQEWTFVWCGTIITLQSLVWLSTNWSVNLKGSFTATKAKSVDDAKLIKVIPIVNAGSPDICKIDREQVCDPATGARDPRLAIASSAPFAIASWNKLLTRPRITGCRKEWCIVPVPEASLPLQSREEIVQPSHLYHRHRPQAPA